MAKIVKIDHVVLHNFSSFPPKALWVPFVEHRCEHRFCKGFYRISGHIKRFPETFSFMDFCGQNRQNRPCRPTQLWQFSAQSTLGSTCRKSVWIQISWRILWDIQPYNAVFQKISASWTFVATIVKIDHVVLHHSGSFSPKAL